DPREVVKKENCNQCHVNLEKHGSRRRDTKLCVLCHTAGMEDTNDPAIEGGTPDVTLEFKVMIHRIHNAAHLPSAVGVQTNASGVRTYNNVPKPYVVVDDTEVDDMSEVGFPVWPNMSYAMPRNKGYGALSGTGLNGKTYQANDDTIRTGAAECSKCHGAGSGFTAPAQGNIAYTQPSRRVCGACHDDVQFGLNNGSGYCFVKNDTSGMPTQLNDSACATCHSPAIETDLSVTRVHVHPLNNSTYNPGFNAAITAITPSSGTTLDPGETLAYTFSISQTAGVFDPTLANQTLYFVLAGPTNNRNLIHYTSISAKVLTGAGPYTINVPQPVSLAYVGNDIAGLQTWPTTGGTPLWQSADATAVNNSTTVYEVTSYAPASGGLSTLTIAGAVNDDYVTVGLIDNFRKGEYVVIDRGFAGEEYLQLAGVVSDTSITTGPGKLYFIGTSMYSTLSRVRLRNPHIAGAEIREVTLTARTVTTQYTVTGATGLITEVAGFTNAGNGVVVSYTTNWTMPATYPPPYGDSTAIGESWGEWQGKSIAEGTYTLGFWVGRSSIAVIFPPGQGESTSYTAPSLLASGGDFLVGGATEIEPYGFISSPDNCKACHNDPQFHGGSRRGAATCLMCHGQAGAEDGPQRVWTQSTAATPVYPLATAGTSINYRTMLHKIHRGSGLFYASTYAVVGNGGTAHYYDEITFPPMPGGVKHCDKCHGSSNDAWKEPSDRAHPTEQVGPMTRWRPVCGSCHDAPDNSAHFDLMTAPSGAESCGTCHGLGKVYNIQMMHKNR
ncbi:MAG: hypothetical protein HYY17_05525, partial [Planctomycetes bacterium]|nr:hypothetical protein [Planctomycetota bacterium]